MPKTNQQNAQKSISNGFSSGLLFMLKAVFISYCISIALLFVVSLIATFKACSDYTISVMVNIVTALGVSVCGYMSGQHFESKGIVFGALCGILYSSLLCLMGSLATQTIIFDSGAVVALIIGITCGAVGGIVGINTKRTKRR